MTTFFPLTATTFFRTPSRADAPPKKKSKKMSETRDFVVFALSQDGVAEDEAEAVADAFVETGAAAKF